jgi:tripartite-type tricarboxylate transporter receptor subunit TctC
MKLTSLVGLSAALLVGASASQAQTSSSSAATTADRTIRVVIPFAGGNTLDVALRQVAEEMRKTSGQNIIVESKPGGAGIIAVQTVLQARPDGQTLLLSNTSMLAINPHTFSKLPYDAEKSFKHVGGFLGASMVLAVHPSVPAKNLAEYIAWAKAKGSEATFASFTAGNSSHFAGVLLNQRAGLQVTHVPFNGTPPAVQNLLGGQVHSAYLPLLAVKPHADAGKLRVIAITSPQRSSLAPDVATFREQGFPDLELYIWSGFSAPAETPDAVVKKLNAEFAKVLDSKEIRDKWRAMDFEPLIKTPEEFLAFVRADSRRWAEAVKLSGFKASE